MYGTRRTKTLFGGAFATYLGSKIVCLPKFTNASKRKIKLKGFSKRTLDFKGLANFFFGSTVTAIFVICYH